MKPIIMSTDDVRGILDGRKTMARRVVKPQPTYWDDGERVYDKGNIAGPEFYAPVRVDKNGEQYPGKEVYGIYSDDGEYGCKAPCQPGDVLWVRETWRVGAWDDEGSICVDYKSDGFVRREWLKISDYDLYEGLWQQSSDDAREANATIDEYGSYTWLPGQAPTRWRSPFTMPPEVARLFLRVTDVRVERVQDITVDDAGREGFEGFHHKNPMLGNLPEIVWNFKNEWDAHNANGWESNLFVWVISFERLE